MHRAIGGREGCQEHGVVGGERNVALGKQTSSEAARAATGKVLTLDERGMLIVDAVVCRQRISVLPAARRAGLRQGRARLHRWSVEALGIDRVASPSSFVVAVASEEYLIAQGLGRSVVAPV
ncbi:hypothetical protein FH972_023077 [Carpinus fangiana]|uniref:Uncharacterized protein n=1 Tax=Carpinus fangiana TaxID=176857 RepID=A0A5N6KWE1_9ROSI|nr:hypothetical protein FH972_023077 [Carpinus fangiana]